MKPLVHTSADEVEFRQLPGRRSANPLEGVPVGELSIRFARLKAGPRAPHRHPRTPEVIFVLEGEGTAWIDGETTRVAPGDVYAIPAGAAHGTIPDDEMLVYCAFPTADLAAETEELSEPIRL
ncbi:MAG TPA: cupin domain-containing protein [Gaiellaceae bacterium]|nr:cupin domain-containing protein [Gaiellaceae bacterium]